MAQDCIASIPVCYQWAAVKGKKGFHWTRFLKDEVGACVSGVVNHNIYRLKHFKTNRFYTKKQLWSEVTCRVLVTTGAPGLVTEWSGVTD